VLERQNTTKKYKGKQMEFNKEKALRKAEKVAKDFDAMKAKTFAQKHQGAKWYDDYKLLYDMVTDKKFEISTSTYVAIAGALAYVVMPMDLIPDFIPGLGFIDDMFVVGFVMKSIVGEIERFRIYKKTVFR